MAFTHAQTITDVEAIINDDDSKRKIDTTQQGRLLSNAARRFSEDVPRIVVDDATGTGDFFILLSALEGWEDRFSIIKPPILYPFVSTDQDPARLDEREYWIEIVPTETYRLRFLTSKPTATETVRVTFTVPHTFTDATNTIPSRYQRPFIMLCCHEYAIHLMGFYGNTHNSTISVDSVDYGTKADEYERRAKYYEVQYNLGIGKGPKEQVLPAGARRNWDSRMQNMRDRIHHPRAFR